MQNHYKTELIRFPRAGPDHKILNSSLKCLLINCKPSKKALFLLYYLEGWDFLFTNFIVAEKIKYRHFLPKCCFS